MVEVVDLVRLQNQCVRTEYVDVLVVQNRSFLGNVHKSGAVVLIDVHQVLTGIGIFDYIEGMELTSAQGLFQHLQREEVEVEDI